MAGLAAGSVPAPPGGAGGRPDRYTAPSTPSSPSLSAAGSHPQLSPTSAAAARRVGISAEADAAAEREIERLVYERDFQAAWERASALEKQYQRRAMPDKCVVFFWGGRGLYR